MAHPHVPASGLGERRRHQIKSAEGCRSQRGLRAFFRCWHAVRSLSLAVLAVRRCWWMPRTTLPMALDEVLSLARQAAAGHDEPTPLPVRLRRSSIRTRAGASLGPQRLVHEALTAPEAFDLLPSDLWFDALSLIVRMLPGRRSRQHGTDLGMRGPGAAQGFDRAAADLESLRCAAQPHRHRLAVQSQGPCRDQAIPDGNEDG